jgi:hypothetical protein
VEGSAVRLAALSNPSQQESGGTNPQSNPDSNPIPQCRVAALVCPTTINPTESPNQLIWTALIFRLFHAGPGRSKVVEFGQLMRREQKYDHDG